MNDHKDKVNDSDNEYCDTGTGTGNGYDSDNEDCDTGTGADTGEDRRFDRDVRPS